MTNERRKKKASKTKKLGDLTSNEVMEDLNCGPHKFWDLLNSGELEGYYVGRNVRVFRYSHEAYKERNRYVPRAKMGAAVGAMLKARKEAAS